ncbi:MAG TPA: transcription-repair coupling factor [Planctomycetes bacterium]|jgi:transcription-repair coupling factor (superfamily II helicase)|nr:transcription-repair coupling factor [Planctomycetota bacterium]
MDQSQHLAPLGVEALEGLAPFESLLAAMAGEENVQAGGLWGSAQALCLAGLFARTQEPLVVICSTETEARSFAEDLEASGAEPSWLPARESFSASGAHADLENMRQRLRVAQLLVGPPEQRPRILVTSVLALLQPIPSASDIEKEFLSLARGERLDVSHLLARLIKGGYERVPLVERPGETSLRGDILDIFPFANELPLRVELFDDEIESLRTFDPLDQRSVEALDSLEVCLANDTASLEDASHLEACQALAPTARLVSVEPLRIEDVAEGLRVQRSEYAQALLHLDRVHSEHKHLTLQSLPAQGVNFGCLSVQALAVGMQDAPSALREIQDSGERVLVLCQTEGERARFSLLLEEGGGAQGLETRVGAVSKGFRMPGASLVVINHRELVGIVGRRRVRSDKAAHRTRAIQSFFELKVGDLVVHAVHGLARFHGLKRMERGAGTEEHLHLMFAEDVSVFVPVARIDMVQRYIGSGAGSPALDKIGSTSFRKRKEKVQRALFDLAADLLEVHARRALKKRPAWRGDAHLEREMIAEFPFVETCDQVTCDEEIARDLASEQPMDRLICGDVGFGKTELAIRAAFRVVNGNGRVVVLVPTTILAQQHFETFSERLADFPIEIAVLSRYVSSKDKMVTLERVKRGRVDILIGTHRVLSKDVRLDDVGLVIIDEEQRFGVTHKEHFKKLRAEVDLLTMTATPIPRTLHMSLSGVRDISALTVPPEGRQDIETSLAYSEDETLIREALLREKNRGGQVFYLHNRVQSIEGVAQNLQRIVPECSYAIGHGQMSSRQLEHVMRLFTRGEVDVLVATTIIESGLDVPAAGTICVHDADRFGLSELHQLRGRVGRGDQKGYCYLLIEKTKPIRDVARNRLKALEEMSQLGAGFQISMKDLEIRGAGNVLGSQQSGHIGAVGYDLYCRLLKSTVERMQAGMSLEELTAHDPSIGGVDLELGLDAYLPEDWIPAADTRIELLRQLSEVRTQEDHDEAQALLRDRFGRIPIEAQALLHVFLLKARLEPLSITRLAYQKDTFIIEFSDRVAIEALFAQRRVDFRPIRTGLAHLIIPSQHTEAKQALAWFEGFLPAR